MSAFNFDPYRQSSLAGWSGYDNTQDQASSFFGDVQPEGPSFRDSPVQGPSLYNNLLGPFSFNNLQGPSSFDNLQGPSFYDDPQGSSSFNDNAQGPLSFDDNIQGPLSFGNQQGPLLYDDLQGASLYNKRPYYEDTQDNSTSLGPSHHRQGLAPVSQWVEGAPDHGVGIVDRGGGLNPLVSDLSMIHQEEHQENV